MCVCSTCCVCLEGLPTGSTPPNAAPAPWWAPPSSVLTPAAPGADQKAPGSSLPPPFAPLGLPGSHNLIQQRTRLPAVSSSVGAVAPVQSTPPTTSSGSGSLWKHTRTYHALLTLNKQLSHSFHQRGGIHGHNEVVAPMENIRNVFVELAKLVHGIVAFCEAEQRRAGEIHDPFEGFPVGQFISQGEAYAKRASEHLRGMRELLSSVSAPNANKESVQRDVQRFKTTSEDAKEVYILGYQVSNAAAGAVLPLLATCSFFPKGDSEGTHRLLSFVNARISSTLRYIYQVVKVMRLALGTLVSLAGGKIEPNSVVDYAHSKALLKATKHLETAEARSVSAVRYFNDLAAIYSKHSEAQSGYNGRPPGARGGAVKEEMPPMRGEEDDAENELGGNNNEEALSLMLDELGPDDVRPQGGEQAKFEPYEAGGYELQTVDEGDGMWSPDKFEGGDADEDALQTFQPE